MSAKEKRIERSQRFKRAWRGENRTKAVSPVVATLILILIAVAAAAALYLWLVAWQGGVTGGIGSPSAQYTVSIGGSTSAYPFAEIAATQFEQNNSDVVISVNQGGSGAGAAAVCTGQVDIGQVSSAAYPTSTLISADGCPSTVVEETIAYDGVDTIIASDNVHFATAADVGSGNTPNSINWDTLQAIYMDASSQAPGTGGTTTSNIFANGAYSIDGETTDVAQPAQGAGFLWDEIPAFATANLNTGSAPVTVGTLPFEWEDEAVTTDGGLGTVTACTATGYTNDLCASADTGIATPCGFSVCLGGSTAAASVTSAGGAEYPIQVNYRSDVSGTTTGFIARDLAVAATGSAPSGIGFTGCGGDNEFDGCGVTFTGSFTHGSNGNPAVILSVAGSKDAIGYASDGLTQAAGSGVVPVNFQGYGQTVVVNMQGESVALKAIAKGISDSDTGAATYATDQAYVGWRPFVDIETAPPTGEVLRYLEFVMDPANNENFAAQSAEISVYASGLAGVVPVTPIP